MLTESRKVGVGQSKVSMIFDIRDTAGQYRAGLNSGLGWAGLNSRWGVGEVIPFFDNQSECVYLLSFKYYIYIYIYISSTLYVPLKSL